MIAAGTYTRKLTEARPDPREQGRAASEAALDMLREGIILLDAGQGVILANAAARDLLRAPPLDWRTGSGLAENWRAFVRRYPAPGPGGPRVGPLCLMRLAQDGAGERPLGLPDGRQALLRAAARRGGGMALAVWDVTPMVRAERQLRRNFAAMDAAQDGICVADAQGRCLYANASFAEMLGYAAPADLFGRRWRECYRVETAGETRAGHGRVMLLRRRTAPPAATATAGPTGEAEIFHEVTLHGSGAQGTVVVARDATDRLRLEQMRNRMQESLSLAQRQGMLPLLAAGLAHDFNNLLSAINLSAGMIQTDPAISDRARCDAERIAIAGRRAAELVNRLLDLGAPDGGPAVVDLRAAVREAETLLRHSAPGGLELQLACGQEPLWVQARRGDLLHVTMNLMLNAQDAMGGAGGRIRLRLGRHLASTGHSLPGPAACGPAPADRRPQIGALVPGRSYGLLEVADDGPGMTPEVRARIFEPYFSTKGAAGTGMGLATLAAVVGEAQGAIEVQSVPGAGSRFRIYWPLAGTRPHAPPAGPRPALCGRNVLFLLSDPEAARAAAGYLERHGVQSHVCRTTAEAQHAVSGAPGLRDLLVLDDDLPGGGGPLVEQFREIAPNLPIFLVTSVARRLNDPRLTQGQVQAVIAKPIDMRQLLKAIGSSVLVECEDNDATADC